MFSLLAILILPDKHLIMPMQINANPDQTPPKDGLINVFIICSNMMSCEKDSLYMANSVNNGQNALDGMV